MSDPSSPDGSQASGGDSLAEVLGSRYHVVRKLGEGAFGEVYEAKDSVLGRNVAIKRIRLGNFAQGKQLEDVQKRFVREAQVAAQLRHPNIVTTHDIVDGADSSFIVMEMVEGRTLQDLLKEKGHLSVDETRAILSQAASALDYAHQNQVVHRDVKPANLMVEPSGQVKVMDFGIAKSQTSGQITATGTILGTPNYMSPEQAMGREVDGRSDLFSLACIAYECLSGSRPFQGDQVTAILLKIVNEEPPPIDFQALGIPETAGGVLRKGLAKDPAARFASGAELLSALGGEGPAVEEAPPTVATAPQTMGVAAATVATAAAPDSTGAPATMRAKDVPSSSRNTIPIVAAAVLVAVLGLWVVSGSEEGDVTETGAADVTATESGEGEATAAEGASSTLVEVEEPGFFGKLVGADTMLHLTVPAGTLPSAALDEALSSETAAVGDTFQASLAEPILIEGYEAIGAGARIEGHVAHASAAGKVSGVGELTLEYDRIVTADGEEILIQAEPLQQKARTTRKQDAAKVGGAAGVGAVIGGLFGGKKGAAIGGAIGGGAGGAAVAATKGEDVVLPSGTGLLVTLTAPVQVTVAQSESED